MDRLDKATRSRIMATVRKTNTGLESDLASVLKEASLDAYIKYPKNLPGSPDFVFADSRLVVFLDSCFWHGCPRHLRMPKSHVAYWRTKIETNRRRDRQQTRELRAQGWRVLRIWEHELRAPGRVLGRIRRALGLGKHS